jgi:hypothetical protein
VLKLLKPAVALARLKNFGNGNFITGPLRRPKADRSISSFLTAGSGGECGMIELFRFRHRKPHPTGRLPRSGGGAPRISARAYLLILTAVAVTWLADGEQSPGNKTHNFVFFAKERELLPNHPFLKIKRFEGAQITYSWKQLERGKDAYEYDDIDADIKILKIHNMKLWIQLQDATFMPNRQAVPVYIMREKEYNGGANPQYNEDDKVEGWVARRWDPAVQGRFHKLIAKLAERYDGVIAGINLQETAIGISEDGIAQAPGFTYLGYRDAIKKNMLALKKAFKTSVVMQYVNFMPGESLPQLDKGLMKSLFDYGEEIGVAVGAPDLMPKKPTNRRMLTNSCRRRRRQKNSRLESPFRMGTTLARPGMPSQARLAPTSCQNWPITQKKL